MWWSFTSFTYFNWNKCFKNFSTLPTSSIASHNSASEYSSKGSRFDRIVPEKRTGSWGIIEIFFRKSEMFINFVSIPSIIIDPCVSARRNSAVIIEDFPAPVRPTMPICKSNKILIKNWNQVYWVYRNSSHLLLRLHRETQIFQNWGI